MPRLRGRPATEAVPEPYRKRYAQIRATVLRTGLYRGPIALRTATGYREELMEIRLVSLPGEPVRLMSWVLEPAAESRGGGARRKGEGRGE